MEGPDLRFASRRLFGPWVDRVDRSTLRADALAALPNAVLALPQGIAFATLAGLPPVYGIYSAIVPCAVAAAFGSSWHVISGPTNANSLALFALLAPLAAAGSPEYIALALAVTVLVGLLQWLVGALRLGSLANFISPSVLMGFMSGAALMIAVHALKDVMALDLPSGARPVSLLIAASGRLTDPREPAIVVGTVTLVATVVARRFDRRLPFLMLGLVAGGLVAWAINRHGSAWGLGPVRVVGPIPGALPPPSLPRFEIGRLPELLGIAFALAIVALGQSISIAKAIALRSGQRIDANREFIGQGLSNIVGGFFSCYLSCGSLNRSLPNLEAGARTPLAAVFSAVALLLLVLVSQPLLEQIPLAAIGGLLLFVAWSLLDIARWRRLARTNRTELAIAGATLVATLVTRMDMAILIGTVASLVVYLQRTSRPAMREMGFATMAPDRRLAVLDDARVPQHECPQLKMLRMEGSVYFGAVQHVSDRLHALRDAPDHPRHLLVMSKSMNFLDHAGAEVWEAELASRRAEGGDLYFHRPRPGVLDTWRRSGFIEQIGADHLFEDKRSAIATIVPRLDSTICARCRVRRFWECPQPPARA
ncbi:MAG: SulP family inorganic anion transporter [Burkholderiales bacterium]|nr:SulP family inorganic anion transporter [Burkholderiales bacterium]MDE1925815.1 SulP family inorganic anion transporter [Burkholderiales bacterium]